MEQGVLCKLQVSLKDSPKEGFASVTEKVQVWRRLGDRKKEEAGV